MKSTGAQELLNFLRDIDSRLEAEKLKDKIELFVLVLRLN